MVMLSRMVSVSVFKFRCFVYGMVLSVIVIFVYLNNIFMLMSVWLLNFVVMFWGVNCFCVIVIIFVLFICYMYNDMWIVIICKIGNFCNFNYFYG